MAVSQNVFRPKAKPALRLLALVAKERDLSPAQRFRLEQWAPHLERDHSITLEFKAFESPRLTEILYLKGHLLEKALRTTSDFLRRAGTVATARHYDGIIIGREAALFGPAIYERALAVMGRPIIFDFDDSIWISQAGASANGIFARLRFPGKTATACRLASAVTPGNEHLAEYARRFNENVTVVPTSIDLSEYDVQPELPFEDPFVVGWTGSTTTLLHFEYARDALERFARERAIVVKIICNVPPDRPVAGADTRFIPWTKEQEAQAIGACHVGIMPLPDDEVSRGKCGLKALQYMATGRPAIVAPVGMNRDLITPGVNGLFASNSEELTRALRSLAADPSLRRRMGTNARRTVEQNFSASSSALRFAEVVRSVCC